MSTETAIRNDVARKPRGAAIAGYVLTVERVLMGLFFVGFALSGLCDPAALSGLLAKAGFLFPLLKGTEVLLQQYLAATGAKP